MASVIAQLYVTLVAKHVNMDNANTLINVSVKKDGWGKDVMSVSKAAFYGSQMKVWKHLLVGLISFVIILYVQLFATSVACHVREETALSQINVSV